jgi:hypothetical protein
VSNLLSALIAFSNSSDFISFSAFKYSLLASIELLEPALKARDCGHSYLGVFGRVITPGAVQCGDTVSVITGN